MQQMRMVWIVSKSHRIALCTKWFLQVFTQTLLWANILGIQVEPRRKHQTAPADPGTTCWVPDTILQLLPMYLHHTHYSQCYNVMYNVWSWSCEPHMPPPPNKLTSTSQFWGSKGQTLTEEITTIVGLRDGGFKTPGWRSMSPNSPRKWTRAKILQKIRRKIGSGQIICWGLGVGVGAWQGWGLGVLRLGCLGLGLVILGAWGLGLGVGEGLCRISWGPATPRRRDDVGGAGCCRQVQGVGGAVPTSVAPSPLKHGDELTPKPRTRYVVTPKIPHIIQVRKKFCARFNKVELVQVLLGVLGFVHASLDDVCDDARGCGKKEEQGDAEEEGGEDMRVGRGVGGVPLWIRPHLQLLDSNSIKHIRK